MSLKKTKIYTAIANGGRESILKISREYLRSGRDPNLRHPTTGGNLLHHIVAHSHKFGDPEMMTVLYMLACRDVQVDAQDHHGDTPLHCAVRVRGAWRIMVALVRCGCDTSITNSHGMTAEDVLASKPPGHEEMGHWYRKFKPGLWVALHQPTPDPRLVERLLTSWCRLTTVKDGHVVNMKTLVHHDLRHMGLLRLLEKHENTVELALACIGGLGMVVRQWIKEGILTNFNVNTMDMSHQQRYPDYPDAPQPLLVSTWATNSYDAVSAIMDLTPDTAVLYSPDKALTPAPVTFHLLDSKYRPTEIRTIHRVLEGSNMAARNSQGQTLLFQAIATEESLDTIAILLKRGVSLGARDNLGRTARDFAANLSKVAYVTAIDGHVVHLVKTRDFPAIERLLLDGYDHVTDIVGIVGVAKAHSSREVWELVRLGDAVQAYVTRVFRAVAEGHHDDLTQLLTCRKYASGRDVVGRTPLMKALMTRRRAVVCRVVRGCSYTVNMQDSMGRTALHYAHLFMDDPEMISLLHEHGADPDICDVRGRRPLTYSRGHSDVTTFTSLQSHVVDAEMDIYVYRTHFMEAFTAALRSADLPAITALVSGLAQHGDVTRHSHLLFPCVDLCREDITLYLLGVGLQWDILKQYTKCTPNAPLCAMGECSHSMVSLRHRALDTGCGRVLKRIDQLAGGTAAPQQEPPPPVARASDS